MPDDEKLNPQQFDWLYRAYSQNREALFGYIEETRNALEHLEADHATLEHLEADHAILKRVWELSEKWKKEAERAVDLDYVQELRECFESSYESTASEEQCRATSWKGTSHRPYGPGGFNRCQRKGSHPVHVDDFGNIFRYDFDKQHSQVIGHGTPPVHETTGQ
jgi:hypothetical protein